MTTPEKNISYYIKNIRLCQGLNGNLFFFHCNLKNNRQLFGMIAVNQWELIPKRNLKFFPH
ncbi:MAG: hypothetical protein A2096_09885 [Spirochaetes bacterium GWF1_41_5]|nr:MAG: hypothetical protein A2096_09885 [Spirochaetes bacterium GWF1_41_5]HBE01399.1 hypothetical protein [Spirochaetia bacterium]